MNFCLYASRKWFVYLYTSPVVYASIINVYIHQTAALCTQSVSEVYTQMSGVYCIHMEQYVYTHNIHKVSTYTRSAVTTSGSRIWQ